MRLNWVLWGLLSMSAGAAAEDGRYQALPLAGTGGGRALILDTRDGHVWVWSENELVATPDGRRRYGSGFIYQGKLRPRDAVGQMIEPGR